MNAIQEAADICKTAEKSLRDLMQRAISAGDYANLPALAKMAEQISDLASRTGHAPKATTVAAASGSAARKKPAERSSRKKASGARSGVRSSKSGYPKFRRTDDTLVKVGWSKKAKKEYEHRAPRNAVEAVVTSVIAAGRHGSVFAVDALIPVHDPKDQAEVPTYQVYLAIAWLRTAGVLRQHGREGYTLLVTENPAQNFEECWEALERAGTA